MDMSSIILKFCILAVTLGVGFSARYLFKNRPAVETVVEDVAEQVMKEETGKGVNFHPKKPEKKD